MQSIVRNSRSIFFLAASLLLSACAPALTTVVVRTDPPGGQVEVSDQNATDGNSVQLLPGTWEFTSSLDGYRNGTVSAEVKGKEDFITVPLGVPYGHLTVIVTPPDATLAVDTQSPEQGPERHFELPPGSHEITLTHQDFPRVTQHVEIETGSEQTIHIEMADVASLIINTHDTQASVYVNGSRIGRGEQVRTSVPRGMQNVSVVHILNSWQRRYANQTVSIEHASGAEITLQPHEVQWLFEGQWLSASTARTQEQRRFDRQKVSDPAKTNVSLSILTATELRNSGIVTDLLHATMRVGDQVVLTDDRGQWLFFKRNASPGPAFRATGDAYSRSRELKLPWKSLEPEYELNAQFVRQPAVALSNAVIRTRLALPLVRAGNDDLGNGSIQVSRSSIDGPVILVTSGGEGIEVDGAKLPGKGPERILKLDAANQGITISWSVPPQSLTAIPARKLNQLDWRDWESLFRGEKRTGSVFQKGQVQRLTRTSKGPEFPEQETEVFEATGPLASEMDLHVIDLGPHDVAGEYNRTWRFNILASGDTQRQLDLRYQVSEEKFDVETDNFLRRQTEGAANNGR